MSTSTSSQLEAIHEMMAAGHRSIRMEKHTLMLWGLAAALLILTVDAYFTHERFPDLMMRSIYMNTYIITLLLIVGVIDFRMTRSNRQKRDETISFVQMQVTKVWWMLIALIVLINIGMNFFGGGFLFYGVMLAIMGIAFFVNGLFSQQMLTWIGSIMILMGLSMVMFQLPMALQEWVSVGVFGLGFPIIALFLDKQTLHTSLKNRLLLTALWLVVALFPAHIAFYLGNESAEPELTAISLEQYKQQTEQTEGTQVVAVPAGTRIPIYIDFNGNLLTTSETVTMQVRLEQPLLLSITNGKLDGRFNIGELGWKKNVYSIITRGQTSITVDISPDQGPHIDMNADLNLKD